MVISLPSSLPSDLFITVSRHLPLCFSTLRDFSNLILSLSPSLSLSLILSLIFFPSLPYYLSDVNAEYNTFPTHQSALYLPLEGVRGVLIGSVAILVPLVSLIYQLAGFHSMLGKINIEFGREEEERTDRQTV